MKAIILAGGYGTRISEETHLRPKPMIEIGGKPILWHIMKIYSTYKINEFIICCGYKGDIIKGWADKYNDNNTAWNVGLLLTFICAICLVLAYKKKTRPTKQDIVAKRAQQQAYLLSKVKALNDQKRRKENTLITALPRFESDFALLHKNFFKT